MGTAVDKAPNRHRTQILIFGYRISGASQQKEKRKCYELSKAKRVRSLVYETVTRFQRRSGCIRKGEMGGKGKESETLDRKANMRILLFGRRERHCSIETGSFHFLFLSVRHEAGQVFTRQAPQLRGPGGNVSSGIPARPPSRPRPCPFPGPRFSPPIFDGGRGGGRGGQYKKQKETRRAGDRGGE